MLSRRGRGEVGHRAGIWHFEKTFVKFPTPGLIFWLKFPPKAAQLHQRPREKIKLPYPGDNKICQKPYPQAKDDDKIPALCPASPRLPPPGLTLIGALFYGYSQGYSAVHSSLQAVPIRNKFI